LVGAGDGAIVGAGVGASVGAVTASSVEKANNEAAGNARLAIGWGAGKYVSSTWFMFDAVECA